MKIPKHIINKLIKIDKNAQESKNLAYEIEQWLEGKGIDTERFRQEQLSVLELAEYGELSSNVHEITSMFLENIHEIQGD
ncbi:hypothetical protein [Rummeliibacillus sp. POC4]|uniref:hypothetical protein n=1 Tax=Rummeliibacillus sp. POC4 TaxID=2305899 RepID=UPI000E673138|nr:hypothetical protein [Rummeliibacillus sp. POC4]RIJ65515.1 hypothetical protein D1606_08065 [Rummeliibacillus sp. POC4]